MKSMIVSFSFVMTVLFCAVALAQAPAPSPTPAPSAAPAPLASGDAVAGKVKFDMLCASCHGATGKGDGVASAALNPKPRNFSDPDFQSKKTDDVLRKIIKEGGASVGLSPSMPAWGPMLNDQEVNNVIAHIRQLGKTSNSK